MASTYDLLDSTTLGTSAASVTFSGISGSYRDLVLVLEAIGGATTARLTLRFNGDTGSNYSTVVVVNDGSETQSGTYMELGAGWGLQNGTVLTVAEVQDFSATDKHKSVLARNNSTSRGVVGMVAGRWANTSAITSVTVFSYGGDYLTGSTFYLYGIEA